MEIFKLNRPGLLVASLQGSCRGAADAAQLTQLLAQAASQQVREIWLLCPQLDTLDYPSMQVLLREMDRLRRTATQLTFCGLVPEVQARFEATGLGSLATLVPLATYTGPQPVLR
jgi:anti-anti-sigma factor